jgi:hypothetical protein
MLYQERLFRGARRSTSSDIRTGLVEVRIARAPGGRADGIAADSDGSGVSVVCVVSVLLIAIALLSSQFDLGAISTFIKQQPLILWLVDGRHLRR